jgi:RNA polymerase sigma-70 factor, ECF subfamily
MSTEIPEEKLVERARSGDLAAFEELTNRNERQVFSIALRILRHRQDAEDITQQTFLSALENLERFRGEASFAAWLGRIATYAALKVIRKRKGLEIVPLAEENAGFDRSDSVPHPEYIADWKQTPDELANRREVQALLEDALERLDERHRLVFLLRDVEGFSVRETAETLGLTEANVKVRLLRARLQLREQLTRALGDPDRQLQRHVHGHGENPDQNV